MQHPLDGPPRVVLGSLVDGNAANAVGVDITPAHLMAVKKYAAPVVVVYVEERGSNHPRKLGATEHRAESRIDVVLEGSLDLIGQLQGCNQICVPRTVKIIPRSVRRRARLSPCESKTFASCPAPLAGLSTRRSFTSIDL